MMLDNKTIDDRDTRKVETRLRAGKMKACRKDERLLLAQREDAMSQNALDRKEAIHCKANNKKTNKGGTPVIRPVDYIPTESDSELIELTNLRNGVVVDESHQVTARQLKAALPKLRHKVITDDLVKTINLLCEDTSIRHSYRENLVSYGSVLLNNTTSVADYINAVRFTSFLMIGYTNLEAWRIVFPERYQKLVDMGHAVKTIQAHSGSYRRRKIVCAILELAMVPTYLLNQDLYQKALNTQAELMCNAKSEKVKSDAANSLLVHLRQPEVTKMTVDVTVKEDDSIAELRKTTLALAAQQKAMVQAGAMSSQEVAESKLILEHKAHD